MSGLQDLIRSLQDRAMPLAGELGEGFMRDLDALNSALAAVIPGTASNQELVAPVGEAVQPAVDAFTGTIARNSTLSPATQAALTADAPEPETDPVAAPADEQPGEVGLVEGVRRRDSGTGFRLTREARLAAIVTNATRPDNNASKLGGSLARPLVGYEDQYGNVHAAVTSRKSSRPWGEADPTRDVVSYSEDDVLEPATWGSPEKVGRLQHRLVNAGFLAGDFKFGFYDETTENAYRDLLTFSSKQGMSMLEGLVEAHQARKWAAENGVPWSAVGGSADGGESALKPPKYEAPDKAEVKQAIKAQFRSELGRDPTPGELTRFAATYLEDARADYDVQVDAMTPDVDQMAESVFDEAPELGTDEQNPSAPDSVDRVSPDARFRELFDKKYAGERQFQADQETSREQGNLLGGILGTLDQVV